MPVSKASMAPSDRGSGEELTTHCARGRSLVLGLPGAGRCSSEFFTSGLGRWGLGRRGLAALGARDPGEQRLDGPLRALVARSAHQVEPDAGRLQPVCAASGRVWVASGNWRGRSSGACDGAMDTVLAVVAVVVGLLSLIYIAWTLIQPWRF